MSLSNLFTQGLGAGVRPSRAQQRSPAVGSWDFPTCWASRSLLRPGTLHFICIWRSRTTSWWFSSLSSFGGEGWGEEAHCRSCQSWRHANLLR